MANGNIKHRITELAKAFKAKGQTPTTSRLAELAGCSVAYAVQVATILRRAGILGPRGRRRVEPCGLCGSRFGALSREMVNPMRSRITRGERSLSACRMCAIFARNPVRKFATIERLIEERREYVQRCGLPRSCLPPDPPPIPDPLPKVKAKPVRRKKPPQQKTITPDAIAEAARRFQASFSRGNRA